jgi:hypothetical protein
LGAQWDEVTSSLEIENLPLFFGQRSPTGIRALGPSNVTLLLMGMGDMLRVDKSRL